MTDGPQTASSNVIYICRFTSTRKH